MGWEYFTAQELADHIPGTNPLYNSMHIKLGEIACCCLLAKLMSIRDFQLKESQTNGREVEGCKLIAFTYMYMNSINLFSEGFLSILVERKKARKKKAVLEG